MLAKWWYIFLLNEMIMIFICANNQICRRSFLKLNEHPYGSHRHTQSMVWKKYVMRLSNTSLLALKTRRFSSRISWLTWLDVSLRYRLGHYYIYSYIGHRHVQRFTSIIGTKIYFLTHTLYTTALAIIALGGLCYDITKCVSTLLIISYSYNAQWLCKVRSRTNRLQIDL